MSWRTVSMTGKELLILFLLLHSFLALPGIVFSEQEPPSVVDDRETSNAGEEFPATSSFQVGSITLNVENIYPAIDGLKPKFPYSFINIIHFRTRQRVIARELRFAEGDIVTQELLDENERNLRKFGFLQDVRFKTTRKDEETVDITVDTLDSWTTNIAVDLRKTGDEYKGKFGVSEDNLFGLGKMLSFHYFIDPDKHSRSFHYYDPRIWGKQFTTQLVYTYADDVLFWRILVEKPFVSLLDNWSFHARFDRDDQPKSLYNRGDAYFNFFQDRRVGEAYISYSPKVSLSRLARWRGGYRYVRDQFSEDRSARYKETVKFNDRLYSSVYIGFEYGKSHYIQELNINNYGREEDYNLGQQWYFEFSYAPRLLGSTSDGFYLVGNTARGKSFGEGHFALFEAYTSTRFQEGEFQNSYGDFSLQYFYRIHRRFTFTSSLSCLFFRNQDPEQQALLGAEEGLRGYPLNYFSGNKLMVLNTELRYLIKSDFLKIGTVGGVFLYDVGNAWQANQAMDPGTLHSNIGFGFRFAIPRFNPKQVYYLIYTYAFEENGLDDRWLFSFGSSSLPSTDITDHPKGLW